MESKEETFRISVNMTKEEWKELRAATKKAGFTINGFYTNLTKFGLEYLISQGDLQSKFKKFSEK